MEKEIDCWYDRVCQAECEKWKCLRYIEMKNLVEESGLPFHKSYPIKLTTMEDYDSFVLLDKIRLNITDFVNNGNNLYIAGGTGNGKTSWAIKLLMRYFNEIWAGNGFKCRGKFVYVPEQTLLFKDYKRDNERIKKEICKVDLLILDDMVNARFTEYDEMTWLSLIERRLLEGKSTIYTGNEPDFQKLTSLVGARLASRIYKSSQVVVFTGKDRRNDSITSFK